MGFVVRESDPNVWASVKRDRVVSSSVKWDHVVSDCGVWDPIVWASVKRDRVVSDCVTQQKEQLNSYYVGVEVYSKL
ncbi:unnamed protein product [Orchesella dallaii]|uniref:Uncharacterized protein n=1 Tax=Orchesella dallaii TaxID=48710 RepID=A0ABP1QGG2_9HEXA